MGSQNKPISLDSPSVSPSPKKWMMDAPLGPQPTHHMTKRSRGPSSSFNQMTPTEMQESDSNFSNPPKSPEPKKKRGRPRGSHKKTPAPKRPKTASSAGLAPKHERRHISPSAIENASKLTVFSESLSRPQTRALIDLFEMVEAILVVLKRFVDNVRKAGQADSDIVPTSPTFDVDDVDPSE